MKVPKKYSSISLPVFSKPNIYNLPARTAGHRRKPAFCAPSIAYTGSPLHVIQRGKGCNVTKSFHSLSAIHDKSCGACMFVSDCFEGSISDRQITIDSKFTDNLVPGDLVLGDRGFTIHDLCGEKGAILEIPPFFNHNRRKSEE